MRSENVERVLALIRKNPRSNSRRVTELAAPFRIGRTQTFLILTFLLVTDQARVEMGLGGERRWSVK